MVATGEIKCIDDEIPFEIPQGWEWCRLGEICKFLSRGKSPSYSDVPNQYPVFAQKCNLKNGGISLEQARFLNPNTIDKWPDIFKLKTDDVLVNSTGTGTVCRTRLFHENYLGSYPFTVPDSHVSIIRSFEEINSTFLYSLLNSKFIQDYWNDNLAGSTNQKELYIGTIQKTPIPLPPLAEQHRIVLKIKELMPLADEYGKSEEELKALNALLPEALKKSILQEAIQGKLVPQRAEEGTAEELLAEIRKEKERLVKEGKIKRSALSDSVIYKGDDNKYWEKKDKTEKDISDEIPFEIPDSWVWVRHNDLFDISGGSQPPKSKFIEREKEGYIRLFQIRDYGSNPQPIYIPLSTASKISQKGDILLARYGASLGKVFYAEYGAYNVALAKVIPLYESQLIFQKYIFLYYCSSIYQNEIVNRSRCAQAGFNKQDLNSLLFPLPPLSEQYRIVEKYEKAITSIMSR